MVHVHESRNSNPMNKRQFSVYIPTHDLQISLQDKTLKRSSHQRIAIEH